MIFDRVSNHQLYPLGSAWQEAFAFLQSATPELADGKYHLRGDNLFAIIMGYQTQPAETSELEAHRRYLDIQMLLTGHEGVACHNLADLRVLQPYDPATDAELYLVPPVAPARFILTPSTFLALFPHDAHMPCLSLEHGPEPVRKVVVKVAAIYALSAPTSIYRRFDVFNASLSVVHVRDGRARAPGLLLARVLDLDVNHLAAAVEAVAAHAVAQVRLARRRVLRQRRLRKMVVRAVHAALRRGLSAFLNGHESFSRSVFQQILQSRERPAHLASRRVLARAAVRQLAGFTLSVLRNDRQREQELGLDVAGGRAGLERSREPRAHAHREQVRPEDE